MQWLARISVQRPVFATVLMLVLVVLGGFSYSKLGVDNFPNVDIPYVIVTTRLPGAAPAEVETDITDKIEGSINTIGGIDELRSVSSEGVSQVIVAFVIDKNADVAAQEVRDKVDLVLGDLPEGIEPPVVTRVDPSAGAVLLLAVRGNLPERDLTEMADKKLRRQIESIDGVGQVELIGGRERQINVWLDPAAMRAHGLTAADVSTGLALQNINVPGGALESGPERQTLRVKGRVESAEDLGEIVLRSTTGRPIRVKDVAKVEDSVAEETTVAELDDHPIVLLSVKKQAGRNTVAVVDTVMKRLGAVREQLPQGVEIEVVRDNSGTIRTGIHSVQEHLVLGALLASAVVLLFLGSFRPTLIASLSIPISIIGTFAIMKLAGFTLNFLTLLALALSVGIVIDDGIVVLENIVRYVQEKATKPFLASVLATREIGLAVLATTLSLMAIFVPIAFMGGIPGRFLASFGLTMAFAIGVSLFVSFTLTPMLSARLLSASDHDTGVLGKIVDFVYRPIERVYLRVLRFCLAHKWIVVVLSVAALGSCGPLAKSVPGSFLPVDDQAQFQIDVKEPEGTSLDETKLVAERIARDARRYEGVRSTLVTVGEGATAPSNEGRVYVFLTDPKDRPFTQQKVMTQIRDDVLSQMPPGVQAIAGEVPEFQSGQSQAQIQFALIGPDIDRVAEATRHIRDGLREFPGAVDVDSTLADPKPEVGVAIDRERAAKLGIPVSAAADALRLFVGGYKATTYSENGEQYDVRIRASDALRADPANLSLLGVSSPTAGVVPLSQIATFEPAKGPSRIDRYGRQRQYTILANPAPGVGSTAVAGELKRLYAAEGLPSEYRLQPVGPSKTSDELVTGFLMVIVLGFIFMYLVLAAQFESWSQPAIILISLPLTVPFALLSLLLLHQTLNLFSALGLLVLFGVVKKNAILQIDHTNHLRKLGRPKLEAILEANRDRLRPILMTTLAFVAGMVPLIFSRGVGAGKNQASSGIVVGGQTLSLLLTLVAVPVAYDLFDSAASAVSRWRKRRPVDRGEGDLEKFIRGGDHLPEDAAPIAAEE
ncbi:MAG TPA: efflux RND transporter permease subunit [Polyangiaceae bacterium]|nr:efflux RND transporter permease subunit [Polyangiaceae bacterium]